LVSAASATLLTTIEQFDPVYVNFSQSSADLLAIRRAMAAGTIQVPALDRIDVSLLLEDGSQYPHAGHLNFLDLSIDEATGTVALRAEVPNPDRMLLPGQFVRARINAGVRPKEILIPQRAVKVTAQGGTVMIVGDKDAVEVRSVKVGNLRGDSWSVLEGLNGGERVIVDGLQKVQPGARVTVVMQGAAANEGGAAKQIAPTAGGTAAPARQQ
jgi:membrane fusion protein (multidrug efflux system)